MRTIHFLCNASLVGLACTVVSGCGKSDAPTGPSLALQIAPLTLEGIDYACYDIRVAGQAGPVVSLGDPTVSYIAGDSDTICSWQYGNGDGGDIAYVAPCDADDGDDDSPAQATNTVTVWIDGLYRDLDGDHDPDEDTDIGQWQNPCPNGCDLDFLCRENQDTPVVFDFTVMRDADQGFIDLAVEFDDIFCSAKLDCRDQLLHNAAGDRGATAVVAFACTAGENEQTYMNISSLVLACDNGGGSLPPMAPIIIPAAGATPGQHGSVGTGVYNWAAYQGDEQLMSDGEPLEKCYWNRAVGLDLAALAGRNCTLSGVATASELPLTAAMLTGPGVTYPIVSWSVPVLSANGTLCRPNPLNGEVSPGVPSGVQTQYVDVNSNPQIIAALLPPASNTFACGAPDPLLCAGVGPIAPNGGARADVTVTSIDDDSFTVSTGGQSATVDLPGFSLPANGGCILDSCCTASP